MFSLLKDFVVFLPSSKTLAYFWNFGSMLGMVFVLQFVSGFLLTFFYTSEHLFSFFSVVYIMIDTNFGWILRLVHFNGASLFFFFLYLHLFKALFFSSYRLYFVWVSGLSIFLLLMAEAFMGYVLVWAQMSFWACVVITSLISVIPFFGPDLVLFIWGGFGVNGATLKFFFSVHFLLPFVIIVFLLFHLIFLHLTGSTSKLYCHGDYDKVSFFPFFWWKDGLNFFFFFFFFVFIFFFPFVLGDPEMFIEADPMVSPVHIVPEWYFLFAYAILRSIPNKTLGVVCLLFSVVIFYFFVFFTSYVSLFSKSNSFFVFFFIFNGVFLSWIGQCVMEDPFLLLGGLFAFFYFFLIFFYFFFIFFFNFFFY